MPTIQIIRPRPGPKTAERILEIIGNHPRGVTLRELHYRLNRPVSMLQVCLKPLVASGQVCARLSENQMDWLYYPGSVVHCERVKPELMSC